MRHIKYFVLYTASVAFLAMLANWLYLQPTVAASKSVSLTATPAVIDTGGKAGQDIKVSFKLTNDTESILPIHMSTRDSLARNGQSAELVQSLSASKWIKFETPDFILQSKEAKTIVAHILIPKNASSGGHYTDLLVQTLSLESDTDYIEAQPELAVQTLIAVAGSINEDISVTSDSPSNIFINRTVSNTLTFTAENVGNIHALFNPKLYLINNSDTVVVDSRPEILLPGEKRIITFEIPQAIQLRIYNAQVKFIYGAPAKEAVSPEKRVIVLPFSPMLLLIIPALAILLYAFKVRRRVKLAFKALTMEVVENEK